ncbi:MAG: hypothetical protein ACFFB0_14565 [Promethearchaeota archaeon]
MEFKLTNRILPDVRRGMLKDLLERKCFLRIIEAHNRLSAIIANDIRENYKDKILEFDGFWASS